LRKKVIYNILLLENSPRIFVEIEKTDKTDRQYRRIVINNYIILYTIDEFEKVVYVAHIYYGGRNYIDDLM
jgi:mRNA-degrading endonuclease RelE of RelBE toxin-antitoxin system